MGRRERTQCSRDVRKVREEEEEEGVVGVE